MTKICAFYGRYSDDLQNDRSVEDQFRDLNAHAERENWITAEYYSDHAVSGASMNRPGIQSLIKDLERRKYNVVLAESLSRISRDMSDTSYFRKVCKFHDVEIITLAEGLVGDMEVAFKGYQNQQYLEDLRIQVRRGQRGRVKEGKITAGLAYGYEVVKKFDHKGEPIRGERNIIPEKADVVRRIFDAYADGKSPKAIAKELNAEGVPSPTGKKWHPSTINGHRDRGYGILNNDVYRGMIVWNKATELREPGTNRRIPRPNPESEWVKHEAEHLRIVTDEQWNAAKARQKKLDEKPAWNKKKRPKYLLSGLLRCGSCGGPYAIASQGRYSCSNHRNKGTCDNGKGIKRTDLEGTILAGLRGYLMDEVLLKEFCEEFTKHVNDMRMQMNSKIVGYKKELIATEKGIRRCMEAIKDGIEPALIRDEINGLADKKKALELKLEQTEEAPTYLHPKMADHYSKEVNQLIQVFETGDHGTAATSAIRGLIDTIILIPCEETNKLIVNLHGDLAGILAVAEKKESKLNAAKRRQGASNELTVQTNSPRAHQILH
jgi:site-specific DNA recombinase